MSPLLVTLLLAADPALEAALQRAVTRDSAKVELTGWEAPRCKGAYAPAPFDSSGRVPVRVRGKGCEAWGWAEVKVLVPVAVLTREVRAGDSLDGAWAVVELEPRGEPLAHIPTGASATRALHKGLPVSGNDVRFGPRPGTQVTVKVMLGALSLEQRGTISPCGGGDTCATLPSGKRVSGAWVDGALLVGGGT